MNSGRHFEAKPITVGSGATPLTGRLMLLEVGTVEGELRWMEERLPA